MKRLLTLSVCFLLTACGQSPTEADGVSAPTPAFSVTGGQGSTVAGHLVGQMDGSGFVLSLGAHDDKGSLRITRTSSQGFDVTRAYRVTGTTVTWTWNLWAKKWMLNANVHFSSPSNPAYWGWIKFSPMDNGQWNGQFYTTQWPWTGQPVWWSTAGHLQVVPVEPKDPWVEPGW